MSKHNALSTTRLVNRRQFLRATSRLAGASIVSATVLGGRRSVAAAEADPPPSGRLNIAAVGLGVRGLGNVEKCDGCNIVALCDVDWGLSRTAFAQYPDVPKYRDFRRMLDSHSDIDAVVISTPDHTHAVIAAEAMRRGKHVFVETPLAHDVWEVRELARLAKETGVITQMGIERHSGDGIRQAVEMLWGGGLGPIREVHCWTNRPQWPQGIQRPAAAMPVPDGLAWDLWLGPAPTRSFHSAYHPYRWRGWTDFGTGALGAIGCNLLDVAFWGLKLGDAQTFSVEAESTGPVGETYPIASTIRYQFPRRGDEPPVTVIWQDGGRQPPRPEQLPLGREVGSNGALFLGEVCPMMFGPTVLGTTPTQVGPRTLPEFKDITPARPVKKIPRVKEAPWTKGSRHLQEWIAACKAGTQPCASFEYAAPLTEMVLLGNVALRAGAPIQWERETMQIQGAPDAEQLIRREYRDSWRL